MVIGIHVRFNRSVHPIEQPAVMVVTQLFNGFPQFSDFSRPCCLRYPGLWGNMPQLPAKWLVGLKVVVTADAGQVSLRQSNWKAFCQMDQRNHSSGHRVPHGRHLMTKSAPFTIESVIRE